MASNFAQSIFRHLVLKTRSMCLSLGKLHASQQLLFSLHCIVQGNASFKVELTTEKQF